MLYQQRDNYSMTIAIGLLQKVINGMEVSLYTHNNSTHAVPSNISDITVYIEVNDTVIWGP